MNMKSKIFVISVIALLLIGCGDISENTKSTAAISRESETNVTETGAVETNTVKSNTEKSTAEKIGITKTNAATTNAPETTAHPKPVEPQDQTKTDKIMHCKISIECKTILNNMDELEPEKTDYVPENGIILKETKVAFTKGESVFDVLLRICKEKNIHMEYSWTPLYNSTYIEGISNLYEFDCGSGSGWMYEVNGWYPNYGASRYELSDGDVIRWRYTCDLGDDIGGGEAVGP